MQTPAILVLEDGTVFEGISVGADGQSSGEVVFNTAMTGYQEILTDPSYAQHIITFTYPHIGNTGTNAEDEESSKIWASGMVIRDMATLASNFRNEQPLSDYLKVRNIIGIAEVDTRRLTRKLREQPLNGCIMAGGVLEEDMEKGKQLALKAARDFPGLKGMDLAKEVSCEQPYQWTEGIWHLDEGFSAPASRTQFSVVAYDYGVKRNMLRMLVDRGCEVTVVPALTPAAEVLKMKPDGVFLSNGPGDPEPCDYAIQAIEEFLAVDMPLLGICLGYQLLALASGAKSIKMKLGHHGANHPVQALNTGKVLITSQNHGFAVDEGTLPDNLEVTHRSLFDGTLQGLRRTDKRAFGFQGHPEASPGPQDVAPIFDHFIELMEAARAGK